MQKLHIYFSLERSRLQFKHLRMYRKYWFNSIGIQKNIHLVTQSL
jgi:hypothetical protein